MSIIQGTSKTSAAGGYTIDQSIRFNDDDSAYLSRAMGTGGDTKTGTLSLWVKRANLGTAQMFFSQVVSGRNSDIMFNADNTIRFYLQETAGAGYALFKQSSNVYRDVASWYHIYATWDTTQSSPEWNLYVNGVQPTWATDSNNGMSQNADIAFFGNSNMALGRTSNAATSYTDAYLAEINCIEGSVVAISEFAETNADTGQWVPKKYTGSYPGKSFYITGADSADLGADDSGNGNDWTSSGLTAADQVTDTPTDNHCTLNLLDGAGTLSDGNLVNAAPSASFVNRRMTFGVPNSGKWAFRVKKSANNFMVGVIAPQQTDGDPDQNNIDALYYYDKGGTSSGDLQTRRTGALVVETTNPPAGIAADTFMEVLIDKDNNRLGVVIGGTAYIAVDAGVAIQDTMTQIFVATASSTATVDFGQSGFTPSQTGYKALSTANLDDPTIADPSAYFQTTLYTGDGVGSGSGGQEINQSGNSTFQPDFVWNRVRNLGTETHCLQDVVRGANKRLQSNSTAAENTETEGLLSFDTDGFTVGSRDPYNKNTATYVAWQWLADNTTGSSNTDGSITSTVSANTTSGFSIVSYTGTGANATVGHGLGAVGAPKMIIIKNRPDADNWIVYHEAMGATKGLNLNTSALPTTAVTYFNNTAPTSSVFSIGSGGGTNGSGDAQIAYCFAELNGFSKAGSYVANASTNGPFVHCGFRPAFVILMPIAGSGAGKWMLDTVRSPFNVADDSIQANTSAAEASGSSYRLDFVSNGFKVRTSSDFNSSGRTIAFMAFAESPFRYANAR